jgi:Protein of unknown function (DUF1588)
MRYDKLRLLLCSGLLACSGRYVSNPSDGAGADTGAAAGAASATGGKSTGKGGQTVVMPPVEAGGSTPSGGSTSVGGGSEVAGSPPQMVDDTACGVPGGQPRAIDPPIANYMIWWFRLSKLIWAAQGHPPPPDLPLSISYQQAGQIADDAIDQAIAETKGIPGVEPFVRDWLALSDPSAVLLVDWNSALSKGSALDSLLALAFDKTRVGALTEPAFLAAQPAISLRGTVMLEALFSQQVPPHPAGVPPFMPPAGLTRREGLARALANPACAACHQLIDPLGLSLENYDEHGKYVSFDAGYAVDASGKYRLPASGAEILFQNIADLSQQLADTCDASFGLADRFLAFALEQSEATPVLDASREADRARMHQAFMRSGRTYRSLIKAFAQSQAIRAN